MNNRVKITAKKLLYKNTIRLFTVSMVSFVLRWGSIVFTTLAPFAFINTGLFKMLSNYTGFTTAVIISVFSYLVLIFGVLCIASGIKMGEQWIYVQRLNHVKPKIRFMFRFLTPQKSIRALGLYSKIHFFKAMWSAYFMIPPILCFACALHLTSRGADNLTIFVPSLAGSVLLSASIVLMSSVFSRYSQGAIYMCTHESATWQKALKFSITATDGNLNNRTVLHYSLIGWVLSCILIVPVIYTVPYIKLCNIVFAQECRNVSVTTNRYAVNILKIHPNI